MDIARPELKRRKKIHRYAYAGAGMFLVIGVTAALSRLKPAAPNVDRATVWTDTVKRGPMLRDVRGLGTLVPETILVIPAATDGRVERRYLLPGTAVRASTVILDLSDPRLQQEAMDAEYQLKGAKAAYEQTDAQLQNQLMDKRTQAAQVSSQYQTAKLTLDANEEMAKSGLVADLLLKQYRVQADQLAKQNDLAGMEVETFANSIRAQLAVQQATIDQKRALYELKKSQLSELQVRPGIAGVLQELDVAVGQRVTRGNSLAKSRATISIKSRT